MPSIKPYAIVGLTVSLILIGVLLPIGLEDIVDFESYNVTVGTVTSSVGALNPTVGTLFAVVLPIIAIIGLILLFINRDELD